MDKLLESLAFEVESFSRDLRVAFTRIDKAERAAAFSAIMMFCACFLPWFSPNNNHTQTGLDGFATPHFGISIFVLMLMRRISDERRINSAHRLEPRRIALYLLLLGALSTATCIALLFHFGDIAAFSQGPVEVRYGFYIVLLTGICISACGIVKLS